MSVYPTLLCEIPAEQRKPVCSSTAALISSTMRAPTVSCSSAEFHSPDRGTDVDASHSWRPLDLCSSVGKTKLLGELLFPFQHQPSLYSAKSIS